MGQKGYRLVNKEFESKVKRNTIDNTTVASLDSFQAGYICNSVVNNSCQSIKEGQLFNEVNYRDVTTYSYLKDSYYY